MGFLSFFLILELELGRLCFVLLIRIIEAKADEFALITSAPADTCFVFIEEMRLHRVRTGPCRSLLRRGPFGGAEALREWREARDGRSLRTRGSFATTKAPNTGALRHWAGLYTMPTSLPCFWS